MIVTLICIKNYSSNGSIHCCNFIKNSSYVFDKINETLYKRDGIYFGKIVIKEYFSDIHELRIKKLNSI